MSSSAHTSTQTISIVVPIYNEASNLPRFFEALHEVMQTLGHTYEIVAVNDGSQDDSLVRLHHYRQHYEQHPLPAFQGLSILSFSRNFGKEAALSAGLAYAKGQAVIPMDADLEHPPSLIPAMVEAWQQEGYAMVVAVHHCRKKERLLKRLGSHLFYKILQYGSEVPIEPHTADFRLLDRAVVDAMNQLPEKARCMKGLFAWVGFSTKYIPYTRELRHHGESRYGLFKLTHLALDGIFSMSTLPLKLGGMLGIFIALIAFMYGSIIVLKTIVLGRDVPGYASMICAVLFMGGIQLMSIGIVGEYLGRIFIESKQRPLYIINPKESSF
ncbi:MAG: glycosyltransferase family 2 protein [Vampirovibrionales bacterium]